jgi:large subunit ribosomal protein L29
MKENADKARALDAASITKELDNAAEQMFRLRFQLSMGQTEGLSKLRKLRKERARMLTIQRQRELGQAEAPAAGAKKTVAKKAAAAKKAPVAKKAAAPKAKVAKAKKESKA